MPGLTSEKLNDFQIYYVPVPLPQSDIQPNNISFIKYDMNLPPTFILSTLRNTDDLKDKHIHLY